MEWSVMGPYFGFFIFVWTYLRHYINIRILVSLFPLPLPTLMRWMISLLPSNLEKLVYASPVLSKLTQPIFPGWYSQFASVGSYQLDWVTQQYKCWISQWITFCLLLALQSVNLFWLFLILRIAYRYIRTGEEKDDRSEYEDDDEETPVEEKSLPEQKRESPTVLLNGAPLNQSGPEVVDEKATRRSPRKKTANRN